jgi:hypothetical protein
VRVHEEFELAEHGNTCRLLKKAQMLGGEEWPD